FLLIVIGGLWFWLFPKYQSIQSRIKTLRTQQENKKTNQEGVLRQLNRLISFYEGIDESIKQQAERILPDDPQIESFIEELEVISNRVGIKLTAIDIAEDTAPSRGVKVIGPSQKADTTNSWLQKAEVVPLSVTFDGVNYLALKDLLANYLERSLRLVDIESVAYSPDNGSLQLNLKVYYYRVAPKILTPKKP
ncbi:hypothetical protein D6821_01020, partial [Candidatus Parcubacteria bacterium]